MGKPGMWGGSLMGVQQRRTPKATEHPTIKQIAWAAGFLEGEGSFSRARRKNTTETVQAVQVNYTPLGRMARWFGGKVRVSNRSILPNTKRLYVWSVNGARARGIMLTIVSLMSPKRQKQIWRALDLSR